MLEELKKRVQRLNVLLPKNNLVTMTSGNVSARDEKTGYVVIKPSGTSYDKMTPEDMVVVGPSGRVVEGSRKPSVDTATHLYIYRNRADVVQVGDTLASRYVISPMYEKFAYLFGNAFAQR
ncbi:L-ribulose-5-phosphate 4-epimerase SgbE [Peptococcaceae bacterium CEB3]|nr:L-ribulose-5-phosphate 4-epimerase SgbE [Peptococcaceae bacterium CEB3]